MSASKTWMGTSAEGVQNNVIGPITDFAMELFRTAPDAIQFGSLALYLLTQNYTFGIFTLFTFETTLFHKVISFIFKGAGGEPGAGGSKEARCRSGFRSPRFEFERRFMGDTYPYGKNWTPFKEPLMVSLGLKYLKLQGKKLLHLNLKQVTLKAALN